MSITRALLFVFGLLLSSYAAIAQETNPVTLDSIALPEEVTFEQKEVTLSNDTSAVNIRVVDEGSLTRMRNDPEMSYGQDSPAVVSLWDRVLTWLYSMIEWLFYLGDSTNWGNLIVGIIIILILTYVILRLLKIDALKVFYGKTAAVNAPVFGVIEEDIHAMDFEKLLQEALARKEYRLAIRLHFLQGLKSLADAEHIQWEPCKTNHDYLNELRVKELRPGFVELNSYFEYAWYGNFSITPDLYHRVSTLYTHWKSNIR